MNNKNEVCIGEDYYLQLIDKVNEYDRLKELYERIYNKNNNLKEIIINEIVRRNNK